MGILTININGNPNIGLYGYCNGSYCLLGHDAPNKAAEQMEKVLGVKVHRMDICGTSLLGVFCAGNSKKLLVPGIAFPHELEKLNKLGIAFEVIETKLTALGNNILCNDNGALVNPEFPDDVVKSIHEALGVPVRRGRIAGLDIAGSLAVSNNKGCLLHRDAAEDELRQVENLLKVRCSTGTINMNSPFVHSGILCNDKGIVVSEISWGPETENAYEALGFLENK